MLKVLVIDDDIGQSIVRNEVKKMLGSLGASVDFESDGEKGVEIIKTGNGKYNLVLLDIEFKRQKKQGFELLNMIRSFNAKIPIFAISGNQKANSSMASRKRNGVKYCQGAILKNDWFQQPEKVEEKLIKLFGETKINMELLDYTKDRIKKIYAISRGWHANYEVADMSIFADKYKLPAEQRKKLISSALRELYKIQGDYEEKDEFIDPFNMDVAWLIGDKKRYKEKLRKFLRQEINEISGVGKQSGELAWWTAKLKRGKKDSSLSLEEIRKIITIIESELSLLRQNLKYLNKSGPGNKQLYKPITWQLDENKIRLSEHIEKSLALKIRDCGARHISSPYVILRIEIGGKIISVKEYARYGGAFPINNEKICQNNKNFFDGLPQKIQNFPFEVKFILKNSDTVSVKIMKNGTYKYNGDNRGINSIACVLSEAVRRKIQYK